MGTSKSKRKRSTRSVVEDPEEQEQIPETSEAGSSRISPIAPPEPPEPPAAKRSRRRAETRDCPICTEPIPLRLLGKHAELEASRVDEIIGHIGDQEPFLELSYYESYIPNAASTSTSAAESNSTTPASTGRRSAVRARRTIFEKTAPVRAHSTVVTKAIQSIKRNRKNRHAKLRDMTREDDESHLNSRLRNISSSQGDIVCPVCLTTVGGDEDVQDAHIEACIASESQRLEEERERREVELREQAEEVDVEGGYDDAAGYFGDVRGTGFHTRNPNERDVDDEIDIDGDDTELYGTAQFNEGDVLDLAAPPATTAARTQPTSGRGIEEEVEGDQPAKVLRELIAESRMRQVTTQQEATVPPNMDEANVAIVMAKKNADADALVIALENKIKLLENSVGISLSSPPPTSSNPSSLCRICLDSYSEPTVSTGCWHTCCRECWLRCLGSTKLCPICKRITAALELRRVYL